MIKRDVKKFVLASYTKDQLDEKKVKRITLMLSRSNLKQYIKYLKTYEKQNTVTIVVPNEKFLGKNELERMFKGVLNGKKIKIEIDPSLIVGVRIIDNDSIYEYSLKNTLEKIGTHVGNQI